MLNLPPTVIYALEVVGLAIALLGLVFFGRWAWELNDLRKRMVTHEKRRGLEPGSSLTLHAFTLAVLMMMLEQGYWLVVLGLGVLGGPPARAGSDALTAIAFEWVIQRTIQVAIVIYARHLFNKSIVPTSVELAEVAHGNDAPGA